MSGCLDASLRADAIMGSTKRSNNWTFTLFKSQILASTSICLVADSTTAFSFVTKAVENTGRIQSHPCADSEIFVSFVVS